MLQRVRDLAVEYNNGTLSASDKAAITAEVAQLCDEISSIGTDTQFNGIALLTGTATITFQVGANDGETISRHARRAVRLAARATPSTRACSTSAARRSTLPSIDAAIQNVSTDRATFGVVQNRLDHTLNNLANYEENLSASESSIKDVDMASEMVNFTKLQVLQQAGMSVLAQANQAPQSVLSLLR